MTQENTWMRRSRWLTQALILSGALNIGLLATFVTFVLKERQGHLVLESAPQIGAESVKPTNVQFLRSYSLLPYPELISRLENKEMVEEGLTQRDLALACLIAFHHFNLDKALGGLPLQKKGVSFSNQEGHETVHLSVFPGLSDTQFAALSQYARTERWPLTTQGLFYELKRSGALRDPSLVATFALSPEYYSVYTLLTRSGLPLSKEQVLDLIGELQWDLLVSLNQEQRLTLDLSPDKRRTFLLSALSCHSKTAAALLVQYDLDFVAKRCSDSDVLTLLDLHSERTDPLELFTKELLISPRTEAVCRKAASLLYTWAQEEWKEPYDTLAAIQRFSPSLPVTLVKAELQTAKPAPKKRTHTVEPGDNLWKIARKYAVSVEEIKKVNRLETERLRPGKQIEIPEAKPVKR
jgi:hypothetical protein